MNSISASIADLNRQLELYRELLAVVEKEGRALRDAGDPSPVSPPDVRKTLMPRLDEALENLKSHREQWRQTPEAERACHPDFPQLLRQCQDLIMKIIVQDRENEQALLRRGLVPPKQLPSVNRQRPNYVANLYRKQGS